MAVDVPIVFDAPHTHVTITRPDTSRIVVHRDQIQSIYPDPDGGFPGGPICVHTPSTDGWSGAIYVSYAEGNYLARELTGKNPCWHE